MAGPDGSRETAKPWEDTLNGLIFSVSANVCLYLSRGESTLTYTFDANGGSGAACERLLMFHRGAHLRGEGRCLLLHQANN